MKKIVIKRIEKFKGVAKLLRELADEIDKTVKILENENIEINKDEVENIEGKIFVKFMKMKKLLSQ